jgi:hypothetical protein
MLDWDLRFAANMLDYQGYSIGKLLGLINDPAIISLASGLPSPLDLSDRFAVPIIEDSPYRRLRCRGAMLPSIFSLAQKRAGDNSGSTLSIMYTGVPICFVPPANLVDTDLSLKKLYKIK